MGQNKDAYDAGLTHLSSSCKSVFWLGGISSMILIAYSLATILIMVFIGSPPATVTECFTMLNQNRLFGLLRLDILTVFIMPFYYLLFYSIYKALKKPDIGEIVTLISVLIFAGLTLFLATPSVFSYLDLSDKYALATSEMNYYPQVKQSLLQICGTVLVQKLEECLQTGALLISVVMLKHNVFNKLTAYTGVFTHGLDLAHILIGFFLPAVGNILMAIAGPLYLLWFPLVGTTLFKLGRYCNIIERYEGNG